MVETDSEAARTAIEQKREELRAEVERLREARRVRDKRRSF